MSALSRTALKTPTKDHGAASPYHRNPTQCITTAQRPDAQHHWQAARQVPARPSARRRHAPCIVRAAAAPAETQPTATATNSTSASSACSCSTSASASAGLPLSAASAAASARPGTSFVHFTQRHGMQTSSGKLMLKNLTLPELEEWCASVGETPKRARQLYRWLYGAGKWLRSLDQADGDPQAFSAAFKAKVSSGASLSGGVQLQEVHTARDGTRKLVFRLLPGEGTGVAGSVETVLIPMTNREGRNLRYTACLSTQVGCAMNCQFCYTGRMGLLGHLSTAQIVEQVVEARRYLAEQGVTVPIQNIVFMGMGEPLHNYDSVMAAIEILATGLLLSRGKIIVSTVGLVPEMRRFIASGAAKLAVSLHATTDEVRDWIAPVNRRYPLAELLGALREAFPLAQKKGDNFVVIEYVMLRGVNDTLEDARRLVGLTADMYCLVNLIVFNPHVGTVFERSDDASVHAFRSVFIAAGRPCTVRFSKGDDEMAACGQLGNVAQASRPAPRLAPPPALQAQLAAAGAAAAALA